MRQVAGTGSSCHVERPAHAAGPTRRKGVEAMTRVRVLVLLVTLASFVAAFGAGFADGR
jgi:hypothetical protein